MFIAGIQEKKLFIFMMVISLCLLPVFQCASEDIAENSATINYSMPLNEFKELLGDSWQLQFKAHVDNIEYECISYSFVYEYKRYFFLFSDGKLQSIQKEFTVRKTETVLQDGVKHEITVPWTLDDRINIMLNTPPLPIDDFLAQVEEYRLKKASKKSNRSSWNLWPISILSVPFLPLAVVGESVSHTRHNKWKKRFNPNDVNIGDTESNVIEKMAKPMFRIIEGDRITLAFGPKKSFRSRKPKKMSLRRGGEEFWLSVTFEEDKVSGVYSKAFFNEDKIIQYEYYVSQ